MHHNESVRLEVRYLKLFMLFLGFCCNCLFSLECILYFTQELMWHALAPAACEPLKNVTLRDYNGSPPTHILHTQCHHYQGG